MNLTVDGAQLSELNGSPEVMKSPVVYILYARSTLTQSDVSNEVLMEAGYDVLRQLQERGYPMVGFRPLDPRVGALP